MINVVSGIPRSGTSLMMQMLAAGGVPVLADNLRPADVNNPRGYFEWEPAKRLLQEPGAIAQAEGKVMKAISSLLFSLPAQHSYKVVFMRRSLPEVVRSQSAMIGKLGTTGAALGQEAMIAALTGHLKQVESWLSAQKFISVCPVEYHRLLAEPAAESQRVADFIGAPLDIAAMAQQVDPALYRSRV